VSRTLEEEFKLLAASIQLSPLGEWPSQVVRTKRRQLLAALRNLQRERSAHQNMCFELMQQQRSRGSSSKVYVCRYCKPFAAEDCGVPGFDGAPLMHAIGGLCPFTVLSDSFRPGAVFSTKDETYVVLFNDAIFPLHCGPLYDPKTHAIVTKMPDCQKCKSVVRDDDDDDVAVDEQAPLTLEFYFGNVYLRNIFQRKDPFVAMAMLHFMQRTQHWYACDDASRQTHLLSWLLSHRKATVLTSIESAISTSPRRSDLLAMLHGQDIDSEAYGRLLFASMHGFLSCGSVEAIRKVFTSHVF
jgi:hypothetical protein